jgi:hypothetical protein
MMDSSAEPTEAPLKVCSRCAVASRTNAERCPVCGRAYRRRWWPLVLAAAIVTLAFAAGYGGRQLLSTDDNDERSSSEIGAEQAGAVPLGISRPQLVSRLDIRPTVTRNVEGGRTCLFYPLRNQPESAWAFCFAQGKLTTSSRASSSDASDPGTTSLPVDPAH